MQTWAERLTEFYAAMRPTPRKLPNDVQWLYPQQDAAVMERAEQFFYKFFNDTNPRRLLLGINPGRFGAGATGINFTAPKQLVQYCGMPYEGKMFSELSAEFIYDVVMAYGGVKKFYADFFIGSVCPLGFVRHGKNLNYYDDAALQKAVEPFIIKNLQKLLSFNVNNRVCLCIGGEKNYRYLSRLNEKYAFFQTIIPLPHPRFVMQYRRRRKDDFVTQYLAAMEK